MRTVRIVALVGAALLAIATAAGTSAASSPKRDPRAIEVQVLAINDFHGNLAPPSGSSGVVNGTPAGGAEYLATHLRNLRAQAAAKKQYTTTVAAGDLIGASPLLSAAFHDEPTIEAMNKMGLEVASVGNHEFDEGWRELLRMQKGGCLPDGDGANNQNSCPDPKAKFRGAKFQYLSANVFNEKSGRTIFPSYEIEKFGSTRVAFIGMTLEDTPNIVTKAGVEGLDFTDEVETANALVRGLKRKGVESIVVLLHEGGFPVDASQFNACPGISGPIVDIASHLDPEIDAIVTGHTHQGYNCTLNDPAGKPRLVTSASSFGRLTTEVTLTIDKRSRDVVRTKSSATNRIVTRDVPKAADLTALVDKYTTYVAPIQNKVIGATSGTISRTNDDSLESPLGNLIADSQKADPSAVTDGKVPEIAFMNPGGIRADLLAAADGSITYGAAFTVQPFNNYVVSMDLTGAQLATLLEQQWSGRNGGAPGNWKVLQVSGITYTWNKDAPEGSKVVAGSVQVNGAALDPARTYRVVVNSFLSDGGDGFAVLAEGTNKFFGGLDIDSLATYLAAHNPYTPGPTDRIDLP
ncbi:bifunctional metallophosphatase/5'-nucleotidase [Tenggerimyces flavus]|uniref:Bifunctional metallophosphatase/5'-nucleotidase n=1 Tax=Tenggerimyces flavus TaxID=1708749 RepID=A0ABV7Y727_9ACTN|nr:bifunctional metallophosphatase/5'-nucleotidase [Tenggerimyces flavus]MBM7785349.1 5'-nucleotidase [Tenggerimyces flavus]